MEEEELRELAYKLALKNALDYGKAQTGPVLNKILSLDASLKSDIKKVAQIVGEQISAVNKMNREELEKAFEPYKQEFYEKEKEKRESTTAPNMILEGAEVGNFASRYPPEPNGYMHIGNAKQAFLSQEFARIYKGKFYLYFDDTNPEKDRQEYVDAIKRDCEWMGLKFDGEYYASDSIETIYEYARKLLREGKAYVCFCTEKEIKQNRALKRACVHRDQSPSESLAYFEDMLKGAYKEGEAVVRFKGDMQAENTTLRDPVILRIKMHEHYRQGNKYILWPTYHFNTPINDSIHGITDAIRSKEYELSNELYYAILSAIGIRIPRVHEMARLRIIGTTTHKRELRELIGKGIVSGYDDPRLVTIAALRRRGVVPEAIKRFVLRFGMSKTDATVSIDMLLSENRKLIDPLAKRLFFVKEPVEVYVKDLGERSVRLRLHPTIEMGYREYSINSRLYIDKADASAAKVGATLCLKDLACVKIINISRDKIEASLQESSKEVLSKSPKVQWLSEGNMTKCTIEQIGPLFVNGSLNDKSIEKIEGFAESFVDNLEQGALVNFERVGFFKLDDKASNVFLSL